ncbi:MAG: hypothetical protein JWN04_5796 [Myxococcaceae bacterium]|nr:hypothetical protein [Myxococcaceae bacterium]
MTHCLVRRASFLWRGGAHWLRVDGALWARHSHHGGHRVPSYLRPKASCFGYQLDIRRLQVLVKRMSTHAGAMRTTGFRAQIAGIVLALVFVSCAPGCAASSMTRQRRARVLMTSGVIGLATGAAVMIDCDTPTGRCSAPDSATVGISVSLAVVGAVLLVTGLSQRGSSAGPKPAALPSSWTQPTRSLP